MSIINRGNASDLRGVMRLAVDATVGVTDLVEKMHHTIQLAHPPLGASRAGRTGALTGFVYRSIRGTTRLLGHGLDAGMAPVMALLPETPSTATRDALIAAINGVYGDYLVETNNPLAAKMSFRHQGIELDPEQAVAVPAANGKILLFIHGLCLNDEHWTRDGVNHGEVLARELGYTPLYLRYNTGLPIASNGRELAARLEDLLCNWPADMCELTIAGHSMGGLVARSACHYGRQAGHNWLQNLSKLVFIGTPHHGAPLERGSNWVNFAMDLSPYAAPFTRVAKRRSAGISDLRHGSILDEAPDFVPLPIDVECYAMAATLAKKPSRIHERLIGDGLVPVDSALGRSRNPATTLKIPDSRQWLGFETGHIEMLGRTELYKQLHDWLE
ncbi:MAG: hypothetical protein QNK22_06685 [Xanthomonadales bacterium]|nr:hypothetical protein [Xanthomonadales bacterium]